MNPFDHQNPADPEAFLDRKEERAHLKDLVEGDRNVLLYGPRRRGKTSLVLSVFQELEGRTPIYADATRMKHPGDLGDRILAGLAGSGLAGKSRFLKWAQDRLRELELEAGLSKSGVYVKVRRGTDHHTGLVHALDFLERIAEAAGSRIVVCLDEFQVVMQHDEAIVDAIRSVVQHQKRIRYVFSGSAPSVLSGLNSDRRSPFYKQLTEMRLDGVGIQRIREPAERLLSFKLDSATVMRIHAVTGDNTMRVVQVLRNLYDQSTKGSTRSVERAITACIQENATEYERILSLIRPGVQRILLMALAEDRPEKVTASGFIAKHGLRSGAHVLRALEALRRLEIVDERHHFLDGVFREYLIR